MKRAILLIGALVVLSSCATTTGVILPEVAGPARAPRGPAIPVLPDIERPARVTATAAPKASPKASPEVQQPANGMLIEISIAKQRFTAWDNGHVVMSGLVSTGMPGYDTPPGRYHVIFKDPMAWSEKYGVWMPWALNFHGDYFIHQLTHYPNSTINIGASKLGTPASHGCVRVGIPNAERLYRWARVGTSVWIH